MLNVTNLCKQYEQKILSYYFWALWLSVMFWRKSWEGRRGQVKKKKQHDLNLSVELNVTGFIRVDCTNWLRQYSGWSLLFFLRQLCKTVLYLLAEEKPAQIYKHVDQVATKRWRPFCHAKHQSDVLGGRVGKIFIMTLCVTNGLQRKYHFKKNKQK